MMFLLLFCTSCISPNMRNPYSSTGIDDTNVRTVLVTNELQRNIVIRIDGYSLGSVFSGETRCLKIWPYRMGQKITVSHRSNQEFPIYYTDSQLGWKIVFSRVHNISTNAQLGFVPSRKCKL